MALPAEPRGGRCLMLVPALIASTARSAADPHACRRDRPGVYSRVAASPGKAGRSVHRGDPSAN